MIGRFAGSIARSAARVSRVQAPGFRLMSTLEKKERGDEARYFAQQEAARLAEMKAKVEAIMASDDDNVKETLEEVLSKCKYSCRNAFVLRFPTGIFFPWFFVEFPF